MLKSSSRNFSYSPCLLTYLLTCLLAYLLTYLLTPWCRVLLELLTGLQLVKKFPTFHGTRRFITALTSLRHPSLSWASPIQSIYPHPTSWRSILILSTHLRLGLPAQFFKSTNPLCTPFNKILQNLTIATRPASLMSTQTHENIRIEGQASGIFYAIRRSGISCDNRHQCESN